MRNVAVLMGGPSSEHDVSRWSGEQVLEALDRQRYRPVSAVIERDGGWTVAGTRCGTAIDGVRALEDEACAVVFVALHGPFGEDGTIQGFLETAGLAYTGSGVAGSALAMDKVHAKRIVAAAGLAVARDVLVPPADLDEVGRALGFPLFVKRPCGGSSLEVRRAASPDDLAHAVSELASGSGVLLAEEAVVGREVTVGILDDETGTPCALPVAEIVSDGTMFDFTNKYTPGVAQEIVPAALDPVVARRVQEAGLRAHHALGLRHLSRSDFILRDDGTPVFLESNTVPGLTRMSLLPKAALAAGIDFTSMVTRLVEAACYRPRSRHAVPSKV